MITLRKPEQVEIYQVELALKEKTKQSPFIAVLILTQELWENNKYYIDAEALQEKLLTALPMRACENLLERLTVQGYFEKIWEDDDFHGYKLTELGEQSAIDESFWVGEKGIYNVYVSRSELLNQKIIRIEKVERSEDDRSGNKITRTPHFISQYHNQILNLNKKEIRIEEIEDKCFQLKPLECSLEIEAKEDDALIRIKEKQTLFQSSYEINENELKEELLSNTNEFEYDVNKRVVLSDFNPDNLSFNRKIKLRNPYFRDNWFDTVEIENVAFIPSDKQNAELWLNELLFKGIDKYFLDEKSFDEFVKEKAKPILAHYSLELPTRKKLIEILSQKENSFYQVAKLETIDYLNY